MRAVFPLQPWCFCLGLVSGSSLLSIDATGLCALLMLCCCKPPPAASLGRGPPCSIPSAHLGAFPLHSHVAGHCWAHSSEQPGGRDTDSCQHEVIRSLLKTFSGWDVPRACFSLPVPWGTAYPGQHGASPADASLRGGHRLALAAASAAPCSSRTQGTG